MPVMYCLMPGVYCLTQCVCMCNSNAYYEVLLFCTLTSCCLSERESLWLDRSLSVTVVSDSPIVTHRTHKTA